MIVLMDALAFEGSAEAGPQISARTQKLLSNDMAVLWVLVVVIASLGSGFKVKGQIMFRRWIKLLIIIMGLAVGAGFHFAQLREVFFDVLDQCSDYLRNQSDSWTSVGDSYYQTKCNLDFPFSDASYAKAQINIYDWYISRMLEIIISIPIIAVATWTVRWLLTGRVK